MKEVKKDILPPLYIPDEVRNLKILIVDDEEYNRLLFKTILDRWNVKYSAVASGMEALELLKTEHFDLLFMDVRMPGIDGLKATQIIRGEMNISESEMPVICISAVSVNEDWLNYLDAGMNAFLPKPFTEEILLSTIISVVSDYHPLTIPEKFHEEKSRSDVNGKISLENLHHLSGGDEKFVKQMLVSFNDTTGKELEEMKVALNSGQLQHVSDLAHKMLPPSRHIGAKDLCNLLKKIEESIRNEEEHKLIEPLISELTSEFETISLHIKEQDR